jgi:hypothetical protein
VSRASSGSATARVASTPTATATVSEPATWKISSGERRSVKTVSSTQATNVPAKVAAGSQAAGAR